MEQKFKTIEVGGNIVFYDDADGSPFLSPEQLIAEDWIIAQGYMSHYENISDWNVVMTGAWLGIDVFSMSKLCKTIYSLEPIPSTYEKFTEGIKANNLKNIIPMQMGFWDKEEDVEMLITQASCANGPFVNWGQNGFIEKIKTHCITWDIFTERYNIPPIDLVTIDIEGAEPKFLDGMTKNLPKHILISIYHPSNTWGDIESKLIKKGYVIDGKPNVFIERQIHSAGYELK